MTNKQVQDFSLVLGRLGGANLAKKDIRNYEMQKTETKSVPLDKPIPVELRYETIVIENGILKIYRDVYERGTNTEENLRKVLEINGLSLDDIVEADRAKILEALAEMNKNASGRSIAAQTAANTAANKKGGDGRVTRNIKGKKEISFPLAPLKGKGYPAPVALNSGR